MNEIVNKFLLAGNKSMLEMHLRQPGFTYSARGPFTKSKERIYKFEETGYSKYIYQNELGKACSQNHMPYKVCLLTTADRVLCDKAFNIAKNPNYDGYQRGLASMAHKFF